MAEGFDPSEAPVRRGRRDPELALQLQAGLDDTNTPDEPAGEYGLAVGDEMVYKMTLETPDPISGKDRWFTYGVKSSVLPGEVEVDAFRRVVTLTTERLGEAIDYADAAAYEAEQERRRAPIVPNRG
jgi:hypothetical protein